MRAAQTARDETSLETKWCGHEDRDVVRDGGETHRRAHTDERDRVAHRLARLHRHDPGHVLALERATALYDDFGPVVAIRIRDGRRRDEQQGDREWRCANGHAGG